MHATSDPDTQQLPPRKTKPLHSPPYLIIISMIVATAIRRRRHRPVHVVPRDADQMIDAKRNQRQHDEQDDDDDGNDVVLLHLCCSAGAAAAAAAVCLSVALPLRDARTSGPGRGRAVVEGLVGVDVVSPDGGEARAHDGSEAALEMWCEGGDGESWWPSVQKGCGSGVSVSLRVWRRRGSVGLGQMRSSLSNVSCKKAWAAMAERNSQQQAARRCGVVQGL